MEYLQLSDIYFFTSKDPFQAVSGTFVYAMGCGRPVISTPIPHAVEILDGAGVIVDFQNSEQLATATINLLSKPELLEEMSLNALHKIRPTSWQNAAIAHVELFKNICTKSNFVTHYQLPEISLDHIRRLTTHKGIIQFSGISIPTLSSGYTLDDNARALIAMCLHFELHNDRNVLPLIRMYFDFILSCQQPQGNFYNYVDENGLYFDKNHDENLEDSNGRAIWALGEVIARHDILDKEMIKKAMKTIVNAVPYFITIKSPRAISFIIKGLYYVNAYERDDKLVTLLTLFADNLVSKYRGISDSQWKCV